MKKIIVLLVCIAMVAAMCVSFTACNDNVITVGVTEYEPMDYKDGDEWIGFDADLAKVVFEKLGYKVRFIEIDWKNKYIDLSSGAIDCVWNGFTSNSADDDGIQRSEKVDFTYNYMNNKQCVVVKTGTPAAAATKVEDLYNLKGSFEAGSAGASYFNDTFGTNCTKAEAPKQMAAIQEVLAATSDFAVVDYLLANALISQGGAYSDLDTVDGIVIPDEFYAVAFKKGSKLTAKVNEQLEALGKDGTLKTIAEKYSLEGRVISDFASQK